MGKRSISGVYILVMTWCASLSLSAQDSLQLPQPFPLGIKPNPVEIYDTRWRYAQDTLQNFSDTLPIDFHLYNLAYQLDKPQRYLGNLGQAMEPMVYTPQAYTGFNAGFNTFENYWFTQENVKYYRTRTAFTNLGYTFGQHIENLISITHSQNINPRINLAVNYRRPTSEGQSQRQKASTHNMVTNGWFDTKGGKYSALAAFIFNQTKNQENGGWSEDNVFENSTYKGKRDIVPVYLAAAENKWSQRDVRLQQQFFFSRQEDSLKVLNKNKSIIHTIEYDNRRFEYTDTERDSTFYYDYFIDSNATQDQSKYWLLMNTLAWQQILDKWQYTAGISYAEGKYTGEMNIRSIHDGYVFGELSGKTNKALQYGFWGQFHFTPDYIGDMKINGSAHIPLKEKWIFQAQLEALVSTPSIRDEFYFSNHFAWSNDFSKTTTISALAAAIWLPWQLKMSVESRTLNHLIYFDNNKEPLQQDGTTQVLEGSLQMAKEWKNIGWKGYVWLQWASGDALALPLMVTRQSIYYKGGFIKGLVKANLGLDIWYNTNYFADGYNPATASFYRQDKEKLKYFPTLDVFFDIQIKRARLFFAVQHVSQGLFKPGGYYAAPDYAMPDRAFKMGVSWQFYN